MTKIIDVLVRHSLLKLMVVALISTGCANGAKADSSEGTSPRTDRVLRILTPYAESDAPHFKASLKGFEELHNVEIKVISLGGNFVDSLDSAMDSNSPPNLAVVPQPGKVHALYEEGSVKAIPDRFRDRIGHDNLSSLAVLSQVDGQHLGTWIRASTSQIWYRQDIFQKNGWQVPRTFAQLTSLIEQLKTAGQIQPWCIGTSSGGATGWSLTDFLELMVLSNHGPDIYDSWISHDLTNISPEIQSQLKLLQEWLIDDRITYEGPTGVLDRSVEAGFGLLAENPPPCVMNLNSDWVLPTIEEKLTHGDLELRPGGIPSTPLPNPAIGAFPFPGQTVETPNYLLGGDQMVSFVDDELAWELMAYVSRPEWAQDWAASGAYLSPNIHFDPSKYRNDMTRNIAIELVGGAISRFDASDQMPATVGTGSMWAGMIRLLEGGSPRLVGTTIDESWPRP